VHEKVAPRNHDADPRTDRPAAGRRPAPRRGVPREPAERRQPTDDGRRGSGRETRPRSVPRMHCWTPPLGANCHPLTPGRTKNLRVSAAL